MLQVGDVLGGVHVETAHFWGAAIVFGAFPALVLADVCEVLLVIFTVPVVFIEVHLIVFFKVEESSGVLLFGVVCVAEVVQQVSIQALDPFQLFWGVFVEVRVVFAGGLLRLVGLGGVCTHTDDLVKAALCVSTLQCIKIQQELVNAFKLVSWVREQVFETHKVDRVAAFFVALAKVGFEEALVGLSGEGDPPVPPLRVVLVVLVVGYTCVRHRVGEASEGDKHIQRISDAADDLVVSEGEVSRHQHRVVCLHNPHTVVNDAFTFKALHLQGGRRVQRYSGASGETRHLLQVLAEEGVARARIRVECYFRAQF